MYYILYMHMHLFIHLQFTMKSTLKIHGEEPAKENLLNF